MTKEGYNLDIKSPNAPENIHEDPIALLKQYQEAVIKAENDRQALKNSLVAALERGEY